MKKLNILHLLTTDHFSGAENVACMIIKNTKENSYYCSLKGPIEKTLKEKNIQFIGLNNLSTIQIRKIIKKYQIDIIHAHDYKASFLAYFFSRKVKVISHLHSNFDFAKKWNIFTITYSIIQKSFHQIIVVSKEILDDAIFGNKIKQKTTILNNVVDPKEIKRLSNQYKTKKYDLIFVGRLIEIKQPLFFIDIVKELKKNQENIHACILGQGELYDECLTKIKEEKLEKNIELVGFQSNPFPYVKNAKIEVLPSKYEGLPMSVIEAMILHVPVVHSGVGGLSSMFKNHQKYICKNKKEYIKCIQSLLNDKEKKYEKDCLTLTKDFSNIQLYSDKIEEIYNH